MTISKIMGVSNPAKVDGVASANISKVDGVDNAAPSSTLLEGFENTPFTPGSAIGEWSETGSGSWTRSSSNKTEGSFAWRCQGSNEPALIGAAPAFAPLDFSGFSTLSLDVFVATIDPSEAVTLRVVDSGFSEAIEDSTASGATGADTLSVNFADNPLVDPSQVYVFITIAGSANTYDFYVDNLRAE